MNNDNYAYAVASVRVKEISLLSPSQLEQIAAAKNYSDAVRLLFDFGYITSSLTDISKELNQKLAKTWSFLQEVAPNPELFECLILKNDYHNLKASLKAVFEGVSPDKYFIEPSVLPFDIIKKAAAEKMFDSLPHNMQLAAERAYDILVRTSDGQLCDIVLDAAALSAMQESAKKSGIPLLVDICEIITATSNLRIAVRSVYAGKDENFLDTALVSCATLDKESLISAALNGEKSLNEYIGSTVYAPALEALAKSFSAFEKWCDDLIIEEVYPTRYIFLGPEPLAVYYLAREAEVKSVRIALSGKHAQAPVRVIEERMRMLYV